MWARAPGLVDEVIAGVGRPDWTRSRGRHPHRGAVRGRAGVPSDPRGPAAIVCGPGGRGRCRRVNTGLGYQAGDATLATLAQLARDHAGLSPSSAGSAATCCCESRRQGHRRRLTPSHGACKVPCLSARPASASASAWPPALPPSASPEFPSTPRPRCCRPRTVDGTLSVRIPDEGGRTGASRSFASTWSGSPRCPDLV